MNEINTDDAVKKLHELGKQLSKEEFAAAQARALNRGIQSAKSKAVKSIVQIYNIKKDEISNSSIIWKANRNDLTAKIITSKAGIALINLKPFQSEKGVIVEIKKGQPQLIRSAFIKRVRIQQTSEYEGVFARAQAGKDPKFRHYRTKKTGNDLTIQNLRTLNNYQAFVNNRVQENINEDVQSYVYRRLEHEINYAVQKAQSKI